MNETGVPSKAELLEALATSGQEALTTLRQMQADGFEEGRYENGWNAREILAPMATIEWSYPRLIEMVGGRSEGILAGDGGGEQGGW